MRPAALLLGLGACAADPLVAGLDASLAARLSPCLSRPGAQRDWCAMEIFKSENLDADGMLPLCERLADPAARDLCVETAMRSPGSQGIAQCALIGDAVLSASCRLEFVDRQIADPAFPDWAAALEACAATAPLQNHCLIHVVQIWEGRWDEQGLSLLIGDIEALAARYPEAAGSERLGMAIGKSSYRFGARPGMRNPCAVLPEGAARLGCFDALQVSAFGGDDGGGRPGR